MAKQTGAKFYRNKEWLRDGQILLYTRPDGGPIYHCRLKIEGRKGYIRKSTKKKNLADAVRFAEELFDDLRYKQRHGLEIGYFTFNKLWKQWFEKAKLGLSPSRQQYHRGLADRYLLPFFGEREVSQLRDNDFEDYWVWRIEYWDSEIGKNRIETAKRQRPTRQNPHKSKLGNVAKKPAQKTLAMEQAALRQILRWANSRGVINRIPIIQAPKLHHPAQVNRRPAFTIEDWYKLDEYMKKWAGESPNVSDEYKELNPDFEEELAVVPIDSTRPHSLHLEQRRNLVSYIRFMLYSGLRPNEARQLKWQDLVTYTDVENETQIEIDVPKTTKTGHRLVTPMDRFQGVVRRLKERNYKTRPRDLIFCDREGNPHTNFGKTFKKVLNQAGLLKSKDGQDRTIYSLRHSYATFMLMYGDVTIYELAKNMGTSVNQIQRHYGHLKTRDIGHKLGNVKNNRTSYFEELFSALVESEEAAEAEG